MWKSIRIGVILLTAIASFFSPLGPQAQPPISWGVLAVIFAFCPVGLFFVIGLQTVNPWSSKIWHQPSWALSPFNFREPLQFFHLVAYVCLAQGLIVLARVLVSPIHLYAEAFVPLTMGVGLLVGLKIVVIVFQSRFARVDAQPFGQAGPSSGVPPPDSPLPPTLMVKITPDVFE